jgi:hypothetical protein
MFKDGAKCIIISHSRADATPCRACLLTRPKWLFAYLKSHVVDEVLHKVQHALAQAVCAKHERPQRQLLDRLQYDSRSACRSGKVKSFQQSRRGVTKEGARESTQHVVGNIPGAPRAYLGRRQLHTHLVVLPRAQQHPLDVLGKEEVPEEQVVLGQRLGRDDEAQRPLDAVRQHQTVHASQTGGAGAAGRALRQAGRRRCRCAGGAGGGDGVWRGGASTVLVVLVLGVEVLKCCSRGASETLAIVVTGNTNCQLCCQLEQSN